MVTRERILKLFVFTALTEYVSEYLPFRLQFLSVAKIYGISDPAVCKIARSAKCLKHLNLAGCWRVTDNAIRYGTFHTNGLS